MNVSRERIATDLFALLNGVNANITYPPAKFQQIRRKGAIWSKTPPANQPAMFIIQVAEHASQANSMGATRWVLDFILEIFAQADEASAAVPDTLINGILDGIDLTLQSKPPFNRQTLGGIVTNCWIEGEIIIGTGQIDKQLMMLVPVRCLTGA